MPTLTVAPRPPDAAAADRQQGLMVGLWLPAALAARLALPDGEAAADLHLTLAHCGPVTDYSDAVLRAVGHAVAAWARQTPPILGSLIGTGRFPASAQSDDQEVFYADPVLPTLAPARAALVAALAQAGAPANAKFPFTPHVTLAYLPPGAPAPLVSAATETGLRFATVRLCLGPVRLDFALAGTTADYYSEDQARDDHGRWGSGGSTAPASKPAAPVKTLGEARARATALGFTLKTPWANDPRLPMNRQVQSANYILATVERTGIVPPVPVAIQRLYGTPGVLASFRGPSAATGSGAFIDVNADHPAFRGRGEEQFQQKFRQAVGPGWNSHEDPAVVLVHEVGHALHYQADPAHYAAVPKDWHGDADGQATARTVSYYAAEKNPREFVAETFAGRQLGKTYSPAVDALYERYKGPRS